MLFTEVSKERYGEIREEEGFEKGMESASARINELIRRLIQDGRTEELLKAASDREFQERLLREYGV